MRKSLFAEGQSVRERHRAVLLSHLAGLDELIEDASRALSDLLAARQTVLRKIGESQ